MFKKFFVNLYFRYLVWKKSKEFKKGLEELTDVRPTSLAPELKVDNQLAEAMSELKYRVRTAAAKDYGDSPDALLNFLDNMKLSGGELLSIMSDSSTEKKAVIEALRSIYISKGEDINDKAAFAAMVNKRIEHYYELHHAKEVRQLHRDIRKLIRQGNTAEADKLKEKLYGKIRPYGGNS